MKRKRVSDRGTGDSELKPAKDETCSGKNTGTFQKIHTSYIFIDTQRYLHSYTPTQHFISDIHTHIHKHTYIHTYIHHLHSCLRHTHIQTHIQTPAFTSMPVLHIKLY